jgi:hypothetical protein
MKIPIAVVEPAKTAFFCGLDYMPETVIDGFKKWAKEKGKDVSEDNEENREMMYKLAQYARATWSF